MENLIHMDTEQVFQVAKQLSQVSEQTQQDCSYLLNQVNGMDWQGTSRDEFVSQFEQVMRSLKEISESGLLLSQRIYKEVDEWVMVDNKGSSEIANIGLSIKKIFLGGLMGGVPGTVVVTWLEMIDELYDIGEFNGWWSKLSRT